VKRYIKEGGDSKLEENEWGKKRTWPLTKGRKIKTKEKDV